MNSTTTVDPCLIPAGVSPNGIYNFTNPSSLGPAVIAVGVTLVVISTSFVVARLFINRRRLRPADWFTILACIFNITYTGLILSQHRYYRHAWDTPVCWYTPSYLKLPFVQTMIFFPVFFFPKAAIFLLYRQLFSTVSKKFLMLIDFGILITFLLYVSNVPLAVVYAAPRPGHSWGSLLESLQTDSHPFALGGTIQSAIGTVLDFYIFFLPLPVLYRLRIPSKRRWQLVGVFSTALLGVAASVVALVYKVKILSSTDANWLGGITSMTSLIETNVAITVGCMPALAQIVRVHISGSAFLKSMRTRLLGSRSGASSSKVVSSGDSPKQNTFGSNQTPRRNNYDELSDSMLFKTEATVQDEVLEMDQQSKPDTTHSGADQLV